jgi:hypothetical protein
MACCGILYGLNRDISRTLDEQSVSKPSSAVSPASEQSVEKEVYHRESCLNRVCRVAKSGFSAMTKPCFKSR